MTVVLGELKLRGNGETIASYERSGGTAINPGSPVIIHTDGTAKVAGAGDVPRGIAGKSVGTTVEVIFTGTEVGAIILTAEAPAIGGQCSIVDASGLLSAQSGAGFTAINAYFASAKDADAIDSNTGILTTVADSSGVLINFPGGL